AVSWTRFGASFGFQCQKNRQPQPSSPFLPTSHTCTHQFDALVNFAPAYFGPAIENPAAVYPVRKPILGAERDDQACARSHIFTAAREQIHEPANMANCVNEGVRMGQLLGMVQRFRSALLRPINVSDMPQCPA